MILTASAIKEAVEKGQIRIEPFAPDDVNPNSYNFHLGERIIAFQPQVGPPEGLQLTIPVEGLVLEPRNLYLASTLEVIGSDVFAMTLLGRSSLGRLGLFLNATADLGHIGSASQWTLELSVVQPLRLYPHMPVGQIAFWTTDGDPRPYHGRYKGDLGPIRCRDTNILFSSIL